MAASIDQRKERGERTRRGILEAATGIIVEGGTITAREVAQRAGASHGNVFHHFGSLERLEEEAGFAMMRGIIDEAISVEADTLADYLQRLGDQTVQLLQTHHKSIIALNIFFMRLAEREHFRIRLADYYRQIEGQIASNLARLLARPSPDRETVHIARLLTMVLDGLGYHMMVFNDLEEIRSFWEFTARRLHRLLLED